MRGLVSYLLSEIYCIHSISEDTPRKTKLNVLYNRIYGFLNIFPNLLHFLAIQLNVSVHACHSEEESRPIKNGFGRKKRP